LELLVFTPLRQILTNGSAIASLSMAMFLGLTALQADELTKSKDDAGKQTAETKPTDAVQKPTAEDRSSRATARAKGDLTFDDLKFNIEKDAPFERSMLPKEIEELNKKTIRIRGWILPASVFKQTGIDEFVLVRDNQECCFGPGAALYDCIMIKMEKGKTANYTTRPVAVKGKFEVEELKFPDGKHYAIYKMTATEVK
jgi:hypothetical protein